LQLALFYVDSDGVNGIFPNWLWMQLSGALQWIGTNAILFAVFFTFDPLYRSIKLRSGELPLLNRLFVGVVTLCVLYDVVVIVANALSASSASSGHLRAIGALNLVQAGIQLDALITWIICLASVSLAFNSLASLHHPFGLQLRRAVVVSSQQRADTLLQLRRFTQLSV